MPSLTQRPAGGERRRRRRPRRSLSVHGRLLEGLRSNSGWNRGLSNRTVGELAKALCDEDYKGVYAADRLPARLPAVGNFIIIVNLGESGARQAGVELPVGHFVVIFATPAAVLYIDPYGLPCAQTRVRQFLVRCRRRVLFNFRQFQHFDSAYCGFYAVLFAAYLNRRLSFPLKFSRRNLFSNDKLCIRYLLRISRE